MKDILVHVDSSAATGSRIDLAFSLARTFDARVTALGLLAEPFMRGVSTHAPADVVQEHIARANADADEWLATLSGLAEQQGVRMRALRAAGPLDQLPGLLARDARNSDIVIVSQPDPDKGSSDDELLVEAAFMETGRPALVVPPGKTPVFPFRRIVVAWNASREASRAVHDAMPLLKTAQEVVVLVINPDALGAVLGRTPGTGVVQHLTQHGVVVRLKAVDSGRRRTGEVILDEVRIEEAELLVMGGYGHSKFREALLGGATRKLLATATTPVLISH